VYLNIAKGEVTMLESFAFSLMAYVAIFCGAQAFGLVRKKR
jgi:hypothetical protein